MHKLLIRSLPLALLISASTLLGMFGGYYVGGSEKTSALLAITLTIAGFVFGLITAKKIVECTDILSPRSEQG